MSLRAWWAWRWTPYLVAFVAQLALAPWFMHDWDGFVFLETTRAFLHGVTPYEVAAEGPSYIFLALEWPAPNSWYAYPPGALLLMTPTIGVASVLGVANEFALRLALKLPFIVGNLVLAWSVARVVRAMGGDARRQRLGELLILFNPFLIFIAAVWGMFDAWMMALLLLSAALLVERRPVAAGAAFGAATLIKIFPLLVAPLFLMWALRTLAKRDAWRFVAAAAGTFAAVCLPFFLTSPSGFWLQTVGMHLARPLQGYALVGLPYLPRFTSLHFDLDLWSLPPAYVAPLISFALLLTGLVLLLAHASSLEPTLRNLLVATLTILSLMLVTGKVVNEQYFIMPISLAVALLCAPHEESPRMHRALAHAWTWGGLVAALVIGFHVLIFLPREVALMWLGMTSEAAIHGVALWVQDGTGLSIDRFLALSDVVGNLVVAPALILSLVLVGRAAARGWIHLMGETRRAGGDARRAWAIAAVFGVIAGPFASVAAVGVSQGPDWDPMPPMPEKLVGAIYYVWWNNPSHVPAKQDGNWEQTSLTPAEGYFTSIGSHIAGDVDGMKEAGIDFVAVAYHGYDHARYEIVSVVARAKGVRFAPIVDVGALLGDASLRAVGADPLQPWLKPTDPAASVARDLVERALRLGGSDAYLRIDGKPVVFVDGAHLVGPSWDDESITKLASWMLRRHNESFTNVSAALGVPVATLDEIARTHPADIASYLAATPLAAEWRATLRDRQDWWLDNLRTASGVPIHLVATRDTLYPPALPEPGPNRNLDGAFNTGFLRSQLDLPPNTPVPETLAAWRSHQEAAATAYGPSAWATVSFGANDEVYRGPGVGQLIGAAAWNGDTYAATWDLARSLGASRVLIASWNAYFDGTSIEPTKEMGTAPLERTAAFIEAFRRD